MKDVTEWIGENPRHVRNVCYLCMGGLIFGAVRMSGLANRIRRRSDLVPKDFSQRRKLRVAFRESSSRGSIMVTHEPWFQRNFSFLVPWTTNKVEKSIEVDVYGVNIRQNVVSRFLKPNSRLRLTLLSLGNHSNESIICFAHYFGFPLGKNDRGIPKWRSLGVELAELGVAEAEDTGLGKHASVKVGHLRDLEQELRLIGEAEERSRILKRGIWKKHINTSDSTASERLVRAVPVFTRILQSYRAWRDLR